MKFVKLSIFALTMGLFIASCGNSDSDATTPEDTTMAAPAVEPAPAAPTTDTAAAAATVDTAAKAAEAPAAH